MLTQRKAKVLLREYLNVTEKKGVSSLMTDISKYWKKEMFSQRTLEKWLKEQERLLQDFNWLIVRGFIESEHFEKYVPYATKNASAIRLEKVAEGLIALYGEPNSTAYAREVILVNQNEFEQESMVAIQEMKGGWAIEFKLPRLLAPTVACKITPINGKLYAKFTLIAVLGGLKQETSAISGIIFAIPHHKDRFRLMLHYWHDKNPRNAVMIVIEKDNAMESERSQFRLSNLVKHDLVLCKWFQLAHLPAEDIRFKKVKQIPQVYENVVDKLLEDVLPHGLT